MTRIIRKHQKVFASGAVNNGQFGSARADTRVTSVDLDVLQALPAFAQGWSEATISSQRLPPLEEMQTMDYICTRQLAYLFQEGIPEYNALTTYYPFSIVKKTGTYELYGSITSDNVGNALPNQADNANWEYLGILGGGSGTSPIGYKSGMTLSNSGGDPDHDVLVDAGASRDSANSEDIVIETALTKRIDAAWAAGNNAGGLSSSLTLAAGTWYHVFAVVIGGNSDVGFDTSPTAANLAADHSATSHRRIGSVLTDASANIVEFTQNGNEFLWKSPKLDVDASNIGTAAVLPVLSVPLGVKVGVSMTANLHGVGNSDSIYFSSPDVDDIAKGTGLPDIFPLGSLYSQANTGSNIAMSQLFPNIRTNESAQIRYRSSSANAELLIMTHGWTETF